VATIPMCRFPTLEDAPGLSQLETGDTTDLTSRTGTARRRLITHGKRMAAILIEDGPRIHVAMPTYGD